MRPTSVSAMPVLPSAAPFAPTPVDTISPISGGFIKLLAQKKEFAVNRGPNERGDFAFTMCLPRRARRQHAPELSLFAKCAGLRLWHRREKLPDPRPYSAGH